MWERFLHGNSSNVNRINSHCLYNRSTFIFQLANTVHPKYKINGMCREVCKQ